LAQRLEDPVTTVWLLASVPVEVAAIALSNALLR
jgi:hypothetical protein